MPVTVDSPRQIRKRIANLQDLIRLVQAQEPGRLDPELAKRVTTTVEEILGKDLGEKPPQRIPSLVPSRIPSLPVPGVRPVTVSGAPPSANFATKLNDFKKASLVRSLQRGIAWFEQQQSSKLLSALAILDLHPKIAAASLELFRKGNYRHAVLDGAIALVELVQHKAQCRNRDGADLMRHVFSKQKPLLAFSTLETESGRSVQEGMMHLFEGVVLALRNPRAHGLANDSPQHAFESIALLSILAKRVEEARSTA